MTSVTKPAVRRKRDRRRHRLPSGQALTIGSAHAERTLPRRPVRRSSCETSTTGALSRTVGHVVDVSEEEVVLFCTCLLRPVGRAALACANDRIRGLTGPRTARGPRSLWWRGLGGRGEGTVAACSSASMGAPRGEPSQRSGRDLTQRPYGGGTARSRVRPTASRTPLGGLWPSRARAPAPPGAR